MSFAKLIAFGISLLTSFAPNDFAPFKVPTPRASGGAGVGNGGGSSKDKGQPNPKLEKRTAGLIVAGVPGCGQTASYQVFQCRGASKEKLNKYGCSEVLQVFNLNKEYGLDPGYYWVRYGDVQFGPLKVLKDQTLVFELHQMTVVNPYPDSSFRVFLDLSDTEMQDRYLYWFWTRDIFSPVQLENCIQSESPVCKAWWSDSYRDLRETVIRFSNTGELAQAVCDKASPEKECEFIWLLKRWAHLGKCSGSILVPPGVYGADFFSNQTGQKIGTVQGIVVQ